MRIEFGWGVIVAVRGFRTKIALHIAFLLLLSALLTDILVILVIQGLLVRNHMAQTSKWMDMAGLRLLERPPAEGAAVGGPFPAEWGGFTDVADALLVDQDGLIRYQQASGNLPISLLRSGAMSVIQNRTPISHKMGLKWAVFWWHAESVMVAVPVLQGGQVLGAVAAVVPLYPLYAKLRQYNRPILLYILLNTVILSIIGLYRIFRIYLRPIDRIVHQADGYTQGEDFFFFFRREDNELNRLSSALNRMLKRISEDRDKLQQTVASLEKANSELKQAQTDIIRAEKMASVGRLAAGIAHEIGNPIGIVLGYMDLIKQPDLEKAEHDDFARRAEQEIQRINTIIRQLLDLARPKDSAAMEMRVHGVIEEIVAVMLLQPVMADIRIEKRLHAADDRLWANADQLRQVLLNLLLNAADAIHEAQRGAQGCVTIETAIVQTEAAARPARMIITIEDNGNGIATDQITNVFDPFFTTKEPGKGTGLGLSVSYMIIEKMGGTLSALSHPGQGSRFAIDLPLQHQPTQSRPTARPSAETNPMGR